MSDLRTLEQTVNELAKTANQLHENMQDLRRWMGNDISMTAIMNERIANEMLRKSGFVSESPSKLQQWGIHDAKDPQEVQKIIEEVIQYRTQDHAE